VRLVVFYGMNLSISGNSASFLENLITGEAAAALDSTDRTTLGDQTSVENKSWTIPADDLKVKPMPADRPSRNVYSKLASKSGLPQGQFKRVELSRLHRGSRVLEQPATSVTPG